MGCEKGGWVGNVVMGGRWSVETHSPTWRHATVVGRREGKVNTRCTCPSTHRHGQRAAHQCSAVLPVTPTNPISTPKRSPPWTARRPPCPPLPRDAAWLGRWCRRPHPSSALRGGHGRVQGVRQGGAQAGLRYTNVDRWTGITAGGGSSVEAGLRFNAFPWNRHACRQVNTTDCAAACTCSGDQAVVGSQHQGSQPRRSVGVVPAWTDERSPTAAL